MHGIVFSALLISLYCSTKSSNSTPLFLNSAALILGSISVSSPVSLFINKVAKSSSSSLSLLHAAGSGTSLNLGSFPAG
jgi:hypothetical protein